MVLSPDCTYHPQDVDTPWTPHSSKLPVFPIYSMLSLLLLSTWNRKSMYLVASLSVWILLSLSLGMVGMIFLSAANASFKLCVRWRSRTFAIALWFWRSWSFLRRTLVLVVEPAVVGASLSDSLLLQQPLLLLLLLLLPLCRLFLLTAVLTPLSLSQKPFVIVDDDGSVTCPSSAVCSQPYLATILSSITLGLYSAMST